jgi:hypothetical protein
MATLPNGSSGQYVVAGGGVGLNAGWTITNINSAIQVNNKDNGVVLSMGQDGTIETSTGKFHVDEWTDTIKIVRLLVCSMAEDDEVCAKYPFVREYAHNWMMKGLKA